MKISLVRTAAIICLLPSIHLHLQAAQSTEKSLADTLDFSKMTFTLGNPLQGATRGE
jgi:hypothetical protein